MLRHINSFALIILLAAVGCKKNDGFTHNPSQPITIASFSPATGPIGTEILIKGGNFASDTSQVKVSINGVPLHVVGVSGNELMVAITAKTNSGPLVVEIDKGNATSTDPFNYVYSYSVTTLAGSGNAGYNDGNGTAAAFNFNGVRGQLSVDNNLNLYVADGGNQRIRKITPDGTVTTIAGSGINGYQDGGSSEAQFNNPCGTAVDKDGNVYVSERNGHNIRKITPNGVVSTYARKDNGSGGNELTSVIVHPITGDIIWSDFYGDALYHLVGGNVTELIHHSLPCTATIDAQGNIYATFYDDEQIWKYTYDASGNTYDGGVAIVGNHGVSGMDDGVGTAATLARPWGIAVDVKGNLYTSGQGGGDKSNAVRLITPPDWKVTTIAGVGDNTGYIDAVGGDARFNQPTGIAVDKNNDIYVLDMANNRIRKISVL